MSRKPWVGLVFSFFLCSPAFAQDSRFGDPVVGQIVFQEKGCVRCHAVRGAGGRIGPDLGRKDTNGSFFELTAAMWNHSPAMDEKMKEYRVSRPTFDGEELSDLLVFLYFLKYFDEPGDRELGKILFTEKQCITCHRVGAQGGETGPRLDDLPRNVSPLRIARDLWNHGPAMVTAIEMQGLAVPTFEGEEILHLLAYLRSQGRRRATAEFQSAGDPEKGKELFRSKGCSRCHGIFGGRNRLGPDLGRAELRGSVTQIAGRMWNHWPEMAQAMASLGMSRPTFDSDELADLFAYITIARYRGPGGNPARGEEVYRTKGCADCHGPRGHGDVGPSLSDLAAQGSKEDITQQMWNHGDEMWEEMTSRQTPWPRFEAGELADLLAFLTASLGDDAGESH